MNQYFKSLFELVVLTYGVTFLGLVTANGFDLFDVSALRAAAGSALPAALVVVYAALVKRLGDRNSALASGKRGTE